MRRAALARRTGRDVSKEKVIMKIIVVTGASSGFGALTARALAKAGHTVYAGIRDTNGRNAGVYGERG